AAIPALTQLLKDPYESMRVAAAAALWDVGAKPDVVLPTLIAGVKAQYADSPTKPADAETTRFSAVSTLGKMGVVAKAAIPALTVASKDKDKQMQLAAAQSLAKIKGAQDGDVSLLLINLKYSSANEAGSRERTISDLAELGEKAKPAVPILLTILKQDPNYRIRQLVPIALIDISPNDKTVVAALIAALKDRDEEVRASSAYALGEIGPAAKAAVPDLVAALKVRPANRQSNLDYVPIATALVNIGAAQDIAVPILTAAFKDGTCHYYSLCTNAARALKQAGSDITLASSTLVEVLNKVEPSNQVGIVHIALTLLELSAEVEPATTALIAVANRTEKSLITSDDPKAEWNGSDRRYLAYRMAVMVERLQKNPNRLSTAEMAATVASLEQVLQVLATPKEPKVSNATLERIRRALSALKAKRSVII
ncbi:MAG TPA: HEAT repeat domain-containing protein, partial [Thermosynechococcaceae cyanobacterium]